MNTDMFNIMITKQDVLLYIIKRVKLYSYMNVHRSLFYIYPIKSQQTALHVYYIILNKFLCSQYLSQANYKIRLIGIHLNMIKYADFLT